MTIEIFKEIFKPKKTFQYLFIKLKENKISHFFHFFSNLDAKTGKIKHDCLIDNHDECEGSTKFWIGKDYTNFIVKDSDHLDEPLKGWFVLDTKISFKTKI